MTRTYTTTLAAFYAKPSAETWKDVRSFIVPGSGRTLWQSLCASSGITCLTGGRFRDDGDVPTRDDVSIAILHATSRSGAPHLYPNERE